jgi:hypothetical protein
LSQKASRRAILASARIGTVVAFPCSGNASMQQPKPKNDAAQSMPEVAVHKTQDHF